MAVSAIKFYEGTEAIASKKIDLITDTFTFILSNTAPTAATDAVRSDITEISGGGYAAVNASFSSRAQSGGVVTLTFDDDPEWTSTGTLGPFQYVAMFSDTATNDDLICYWTLASAHTISAPGKFIFRLDGESITFS